MGETVNIGLTLLLNCAMVLVYEKKGGFAVKKGTAALLCVFVLAGCEVEPEQTTARTSFSVPVETTAAPISEPGISLETVAPFIPEEIPEPVTTPTPDLEPPHFASLDEINRDEIIARIEEIIATARPVQQFIDGGFFAEFHTFVLDEDGNQITFEEIEETNGINYYGDPYTHKEVKTWACIEETYTEEEAEAILKSCYTENGYRSWYPYIDDWKYTKVDGALYVYTLTHDYGYVKIMQYPDTIQLISLEGNVLSVEMDGWDDRYKQEHDMKFNLVYQDGVWLSDSVIL